MTKKNKLVLSAIAGVLVTAASHAGEVGDLTVFTAGTKAVAAEVNNNFQTIKSAVNDNDARIAALEALVETLQATVAAQADTIDTLKTQLQTQQATLSTQTTAISALEAKTASMSLVTHNGQPTVRFSGVNVQIVNGLHATDTINGTGNLIVGYDEADTSRRSRCTVGWYNSPIGTVTVTDAATCAAAGGTWTNEGFKTGSHYIIAGSENNYSGFGGVVFGYQNTSNAEYANVTGGRNNMAAGHSSNVSGGGYNSATGLAASVSGGSQNTAGPYASVTGGSLNEATVSGSSVSGGYSNTATGQYSSISGGNGCTLSSTNKWGVGQPSAACHSTLQN
jgi:uncharacterized coiled-coil protein SlyX